MPKIIKPKEVVTAEKEAKERQVNTYLLMFKVEGHTTWRLNIFAKKEMLEEYLRKNPAHPKMTEKKWFIVDRIDANITLE